MNDSHDSICELSRRDFLGASAAGLAGLGALSWASQLRANSDAIRSQGRACILLWMQGGPSQFETFDPKPGHANGGPTKSISTSVPGIHVAEHWPQVAKELDDIAILRSLTNREGNHQRASYQLHTGYVPSANVKYPTLGSIVSAEIGSPEADLPSFVAVGGTQPTLRGGFLGSQHDPFVLQRAGRRPQNTRTAVQNDRVKRRLSLLRKLQNPSNAQIDERIKLYERTGRLTLSPKLGAFDLEKEPAKLRAAYGDTEFGRGCLLARRLVESGVSFVEVRSGNWDTHQDNFNRVKGLSGQVDPAMATLLRDLRDRGLLDSTLVIWMGEFGRTPKINGRTGRDHFPRAFNAAMAGAGVRGGQVIGATTDDGMAVKDRPIAVPDLFASICHGLRIDQDKENTATLGRPIRIVDGGRVVRELFGRTATI
ncbi:MAG: DUF1501 domain-containing protein [Planctomycetota bacterium]